MNKERPHVENSTSFSCKRQTIPMRLCLFLVLVCSALLWAKPIEDLVQVLEWDGFVTRAIWLCFSSGIAARLQAASFSVWTRLLPQHDGHLLHSTRRISRAVLLEEFGQVLSDGCAI
jgi:ABC-type sulfate transport system permease component